MKKLGLLLVALFAMQVALATETLFPIEHGSIDVIHECFPLWNIDTAPEGAVAESGILFSTAGLSIRVRANNAPLGWTDIFTQATSTIEAITTIGTHLEPTATKIRIGECETGSGLYQIQVADAIYATTNANSLTFEILDTSSPTFATQILKINLNVIDLDTLVDAVFDESCTGHVSVGTTGEKICTTIDAIHTVVGTSGVALESDAVNSATVATNAIGPDELVGLLVAGGTTDSGTTSSFVDAALTQADVDHWAKNTAVVFTSGTVSGQVFCVIGFVPASDTVNFSPPATQSIGTDSYVLMAAPGCDPFR